MRITTRLRIISTGTIVALAVLVPILIWSFIEFRNAKNDYILADAIKVNFFERAAFRDQYFLYREERARVLWYKNKETSDHLLRQAKVQFKDEEDQWILAQLNRNIEDTAAIFQRIINNTEAFNSAAGNRKVYEELDKRLYSQLLLKATAVRDMATALGDGSARRVEHAYRLLTLLIGLFAATLAVATILTSMQLGKLIRKRLAPLHDGAKIVTDGNLDYRIQDDGADEFSELATSINAMSEKLASEINAHMQAEISLRNSEERFRAIIESSPIPFAINDNKKNVTYLNSAFTRVFGYTLDDIPTLADWWPKAYPDPDYRRKMADSWRANLEKSLRENKPFEPMEVNIRCKDSAVQVALVSATPIGNSNEYLVYFYDITERKMAETRLQELNDALNQWVEDAVAKNMMQERMLIQQSRLAALGEMIHNIAHQWRQPINALTLILANIKDAYDYNDLTKEYLEKEVQIGQGLIQKMSTTIDDFRNFFKPDKKQQIFLAHESVDEAIKLIGESLTSHHIKIIKEYSADPCTVVGYHNELAQVVLNALSNAKEAIVGQNIDGEIHIKVEKRPDWAIISIRNNGDGIPEDILPKVFDPYFTTKEKGSGIGLYMSKMIMNNMDGDITIHNVDDGVEVRLTLPLSVDASTRTRIEEAAR